MKKLILSLTVAATLLASCTSSDNDSQTEIVVSQLSGDITADKVLAKGNYELTSAVRVKSGATLTIAAGSILTADDANGLITITVEKGGKLMMVGTAAEPIVCTSKTKESGKWGGIVIYGDAEIVPTAPTNPATTLTATSEDGSNTKYGGTSNASSGILKYVRVEYAGRKTSDGKKELNAFSFYAVGSDTVLENLVAYKGSDDGFEFYGGTVSMKNAISYGNTDDSFDWQDGWRGQNSSNWYAYQVGTANYGMEIESRGVNNSFYPMVSGITLKRAAGTITEGGTSAAEYDAIQFKNQGNGFYSNIYIEGYTDPSAVAVRIQDAATNNDQVNGSKIKLTDVKIMGTTPLQGIGVAGITVNFPVGFYTLSTTATGASLTAGAWSTVDGVSLIK